MREAAGLEEQTIEYLLRYQYGEQLVKKLAEAMESVTRLHRESDDKLTTYEGIKGRRNAKSAFRNTIFRTCVHLKTQSVRLMRDLCRFCGN